MPTTELAIQTLITDRCRELGLKRSELVRRSGYKNLSKGTRRLDQIYAGEVQKTTVLLRGLAVALELSPEVVQQALKETAQKIKKGASCAAEAEAACRTSFKPHGYLLGTHTRPSQLVIFGITGGVERWLKIPFDLSQPPLSYAAQALAVVQRTPHVPFFGTTTGFIVNYTLDHAVRFDLEGKPVETLSRAYRPMKVALSLGRREVSAESLGHVLGSLPEGPAKGTSATYTSAGVPHFASMSSMGQKRTSRIHRFGYAVKT